MRTHKASSSHGNCRDASGPSADIASEHIAEQVVSDLGAVDTNATSIRCGKAEQGQVSVPGDRLVEDGKARPDATRKNHAAAELLEDAGRPFVTMRTRTIARGTFADMADDPNPPADM